MHFFVKRIIGRTAGRQGKIEDMENGRIPTVEQMPKVSVIIPVYNAEKYLRQCLDSVVNQTLREIEIICVDDGSTDGSLAILQEYAANDARVKVLQNDTNLKAGRSRNKALKLARGEYIHFLDADDYVASGSYDKVYESAHKNDVDVIRTRSYDLDAHTLAISLSEINSLSKVDESDFGQVFSFLDNPKLFLSIPVVPWGGFFRRNFLLDHSIEYNDLMCVNDRSFYAQCIFAASRIMLLDIFLVYYRVNNSNSLVGNRAKFFDCHFKSYKLIEKYSLTLPTEIRKLYLENELYDIWHWMIKLSYSKYRDLIADSAAAFLNELDTSLWHSAQHTDWYMKILSAIRQIRENCVPDIPKCDKPKVSVIMPVYNAQNFLNDAIKSVLAQSMKALELICVDDGSTDGSLDILQYYASHDKRVTVLQQKHEFAGAARNKGIHIAQGAYITFLDSDDLMLPDALKNLCQAIETENADVAISKARYFSVNPKKSFPADWVYNSKIIAEVNGVISLQTCPKYLFQISSGEPWSKIFRRDFILQKHILFPALPRSEDVYFVFLAYSLANKITSLEKETILYRILPGSGLEANKDKFPTAPCQSRILLCKKLIDLGLYSQVKQSYVNNAISGFLYNMSTFSSGEAFAQLYSEFIEQVVPTLGINFKNPNYFFNKQHYDYMKELIDDGGYLNHLYKYYRLYVHPLNHTNPQGANRDDTPNGYEQSASYRIGRFITWIPRKVRGFFRCCREHGWRYTCKRVLVHLHLK